MDFNTTTSKHHLDWQALRQATLQALKQACQDFTPPTFDNLPCYTSLWKTHQAQNPHKDNDETALTDWLITVFNTTFKDYHTLLVRGGDEPIYLAPKDGTPAQIVFAHGYFSSALHEISHWCIAGSKRRQMDDFGYWYCPDGRNQDTQRQFEQVEIKPQAIEFIFTVACGRKFFVSADNLNADFDTTDSMFEQDVYCQVIDYIDNIHTLPKDAQRFAQVLFCLCQPSAPLKDSHDPNLSTLCACQSP